MGSIAKTPLWWILLFYIPLISFTSIWDGHACIGGPSPPYPPSKLAPINQWKTPKSQLPQLINSEGNLNNASPISPLTIYAPTQQQNKAAAVEEGTQQVSASNIAFSDRIHAMGEKLASAPVSVGEAMGDAAKKVSNAFQKTGESALTRLKESRQALPDKVHALLDDAVQIFSQPGSEKQQWDKIVKSVESTAGLSDAERRNFYQKIADATFLKLG